MGILSDSAAVDSERGSLLEEAHVALLCVLDTAGISNSSPREDAQQVLAGKVEVGRVEGNVSRHLQSFEVL